VILKLLVITDGSRFCNIKETDNNNNKYVIHVDSHFSLGSTARQPKLFAISRILTTKFLYSAEFFLVHAIIRLIQISAEFFPSHPYFLSDCRLGVTQYT